MRGRSAFALPLLIALASACGEAAPDPDIAEPPTFVRTNEAACALAAEAVIAGRFFREEQIVGCDGGGELEEYPGLAWLRLNAECREEICGSVLLGWYFVDVEAGKVFETNHEAEASGLEITVGSHGQDVGILENSITMPEGADPIHEYRRHYSEDRDGKIIGRYFRSGEGEARQWHDKPEEIPTVLDGGCAVVNVRYDPRAETFESVICNGVA